MDEIKRFFRPVKPLALDIIDIELAIRRYPRRLDGAKVGTNYCSTGKFICKVKRPDSGAGAKVKDTLWFAIYGCAEESPSKYKAKDVVMQVETILLRFVIW